MEGRGVVQQLLARSAAAKISPRPITLTRETPLLDEGGWYYFVHSYCCVPSDPAVTVATADYGGAFCAAVQRGPLFACQFHPEKSQRRGAKLLESFLRWS